MYHSAQQGSGRSQFLSLVIFILALLNWLICPVRASATQVLTTIEVTPSMDLVVAGTTEQFAAVANDQNGTPMATQPSFSWNVSGGGTISPGGILSASPTTGDGFTVTASTSGISGTANFNVVSTRTVTFGTPTTLPISGPGQNGAAVVDLDGDGHQDIVVRDNSGTGLIFFFGKGDGTFTEFDYPNALPGPAVNYVGLAFGDLAKNGHTDIVCTAGNSVAVINNLGNRTFSAPIIYPAAEGVSSIALGDFNEDGFLDIACACFGSGAGPGPNQLAVLLNDGSGAFGSPATYTLQSGNFGYAAGIATLQTTPSNHLDIVVSEEDELATPSSTYFLGNGDGTFTLSPISPLSVAGGSLLTTDLNNDGIPDIVASDHWTGQPRWGIGDGIGGFNQMTADGFGFANSITTADMEGTGYQDLVQAYSGSTNLAIYSNNGDGTFAPGVGYMLASTYPAAGDFDEDGQPDLAMFLNSSEILIYLNTTNPAPTITSLTPSSAPAHISTPLVIHGHGFLNRSVINWNGATLPTTFNYINKTLTANITSSMTFLPGTTAVTVTTAGPGGGTSNSAVFSYQHYAPVVSDQGAAVPFATPTAATLIASDQNIPAQALTYAVVTQPIHGTLSGTAPNLIYTPNLGFSGTDSFTFTVTNTVPYTSASATFTLDVIPSLHTFAAGLQMISAPYDDSSFTLAQIFDQPGVRMAVWSPSTLQYVISPNPPADTLHPVQGYWARFTQPTNLIPVGEGVGPNTAPSIALNPGWNLIGNPRGTAVSESGVIIVNGATNLTFTQAMSDDLIGGSVFTFTPGDVSYEQQSDPSISFAPYAGYWIYAVQPVTLTFPPLGP